MPKAGRIRLSEARELYLSSRRGRLSPSTVENDGYVTRRLVADLGDMQVESVKPHHLEAWFTALLVEHRTRDGVQRPPVSAVTFNNLHQRVSQFARFVQVRGLARTDWMAHVARMKVPQKRQQQVGIEILWAMLDVLADEPRDRAVLAFACNTASRSADVTALRIGDVDLDDRTVLVRVQKSQVEDTMVVTDHLHEELMVWLDHYGREVLRHDARVLSEADFLFPAKRQPLLRGWQETSTGRRVVLEHRGYNPSKRLPKPHTIVQRALDGVGLPTKGQGLHTIRRSVARIVFDGMQDTGYDHALRTVSALLHHGSSAVTEKYLGLDSEVRKRDEHMRTVGVLGPRPAGPASVTRLAGYKHA